MAPAGKIAMQSLLCVLLLAKRASSLNMVVQVTVTPKIKPLLGLNLCSLPLLSLLQPLMTSWVTNATLPYVSDFKLPALFLTYHKTSLLRKRTRLLRANDENTATTQRFALTKISPTSCTRCSSSGCTTYCGTATCKLCGSSRRHLQDFTATTIMNVTTFDDLSSDHERQLAMVDFAKLGVVVSGTVQKLLQSFLLSNVLSLLGLSCLGDPSSVTTNVTFLVNQTLVIG